MSDQCTSGLWRPSAKVVVRLQQVHISVLYSDFPCLDCLALEVSLTVVIGQRPQPPRRALRSVVGFLGYSCEICLITDVR